MMRYRPTTSHLLNMSAQEVFDYATRHLMTQGRRSVGPYGCVYRDESGGACVVGAFIPDSVYTPELEGKAAVTLAHLIKEPFTQAFFLRHAPLLQSLQRVHDAINPSGWVWAMSKVADMYDLRVEVLHDFCGLEAENRYRTVPVAPPLPMSYAEHHEAFKPINVEYYQMPECVLTDANSKAAALALMGAKIAPKIPEPLRPVFA